MTTYRAKYCGHLPVDVVNHYLKTSIDPGEVFMSAQAHQHIAEKHPEDYDLVRYYLEQGISRPTYVGQGPKQKDNFEFVYVIEEPLPKRDMLVAVALKKDRQGRYRIKSAYLLDNGTVQNRLSKQYLFKVDH